MANTAVIPSSVPRLRWWRILPPCMLVYVMSFLNRLSFGFAMAGGMNQELGMTAAVAGLAAGVFSFGYLLLQFSGGDYAAKHSAKTAVTWISVAWGIVAIGTGFCTSPTQMLVARFLLGVAEGALWPAVFVLISDWFPSEELARANALFTMGATVAQAINGPLSGWLVADYGWRDMFFIEGALSLAMVPIWLILISDRPAQAKWLSSGERDYLVAKIHAEQEALSKGRKKVSYADLCKDINLWKLVAIYFCFQIGVTSYVYWLPTIMSQLTKAGIAMTGWLTAVPYVTSALGLYLFAHWSDATGNRRLFVALPAIGAAVCLFLSVEVKEMIWISYAFLALSGLFYGSHNGVFWSIPPALFPREVAGGARGIVNGMGNLGGFVGPTMVGWFITTFGSSDRGIYGMAIAWLFACVFVYTLPKALSKLEPKHPARPAETTGHAAA